VGSVGGRKITGYLKETVQGWRIIVPNPMLQIETAEMRGNLGSEGAWGTKVHPFSRIEIDGRE